MSETVFVFNPVHDQRFYYKGNWMYIKTKSIDVICGGFPISKMRAIIATNLFYGLNNVIYVNKYNIFHDIQAFNKYYALFYLLLCVIDSMSHTSEDHNWLKASVNLFFFFSNW